MVRTDQLGDGHLVTLTDADESLSSRILREVEGTVAVSDDRRSECDDLVEGDRRRDLLIASLRRRDVREEDGTGHLVVTYAVPFLVTPTVQITARQGLLNGGNIVVTESDSNHFKVEQRNAAGAATPSTGASVDYFVQGYGGHS